MTQTSKISSHLATKSRIFLTEWSKTRKKGALKVGGSLRKGKKISRRRKWSASTSPYYLTAEPTIWITSHIVLMFKARREIQHLTKNKEDRKNRSRGLKKKKKTKNVSSFLITKSRSKKREKSMTN